MELSTGFALVGLVMAVISAVGAVMSSRNALALDDAERTLASATKNAKGMADRLSAMEGRLDRLAGRLYATTRKPAPPTEPDELPELLNERARVILGNGVLDPELAAELALQNAGPVAPGARK